MKVNVVIDIEMCTVSSKSQKYPGKHEIIQIGAVMMNDLYEIVDKFSTYVTPRYGKINNYILSLTGISERTIKGAPEIEEALEAMIQWIGEREAIFFSWSPTDYYQIRKEVRWKCREEVKEEPGWAWLLNQDNWIDYQEAFGKRLGSTRNLALMEALDLAEVEIEGRLHDGLDDAYNTACLISKLETDKAYQTLLERFRTREEERAPLTVNLGSLMQGLILEPA